MVHPPSVPGARSFLTLMLAKVPGHARSLPPRDPYELNIAGWTPGDQELAGGCRR